MQSEVVSQWLDPAHVRALAEVLLVPNARGNGLANEKMFGSSFEGFDEPVSSSNTVTAVARQSLSDAQTRAASSGILRDREEEITPEAASTSKQDVPVPDSVQIEDSESEQATNFLQSAAEKDEGSDRASSVFSPPQAFSSAPPEVVSQPSSEVFSQPSPEVVSSPSPLALPSNPFLQGVTSPKIERIQVGRASKSESSVETRRKVVDSPFKIASPPEQESPMAHQPTVIPPVTKQESSQPLPLSTRLQAFGNWLKEQIPTRSYFICDRHGEIVVDEVGSEKLVKVARTLAHASRSAGREVGEGENLGSLHVKIGPDRVMEVVPRHSHFGLVVLGVIVQRPLSRDAVASISRALGTALAEPLASRQ